MYGKGLRNFIADSEENLVTVTKTSRSNNFKLKESTGRLMCLLDEIDAKTRTKAFKEELVDNPSAIKLTNEYDDCSVYKKLSRICQCLNRTEYIDIIMEFNTDTRYHTTHFGEILKNMRSLKKFLYIGNDYCRNALNFLIEGLSTSTATEKEELIKGCAYADICNIFEDNSIVKKCIIYDYENKLGHTTIPILAAKFLDKLAANEEGKQYLTMSTKLTQEMNEFVKREGINLDPTLGDIIYDVLDVLKPGPMIKDFYFKHVHTSDCSRTVNIFVQYHDYMTLEEVSNYLQTLQTLSDSPITKSELVKQIPLLISVFKGLLIKFNDSELNIMVTNILNNIVTRNLFEDEVESVRSTSTLGLKGNLKNRSTSPVNILENNGKKSKVDFHIRKNIPALSKQTKDYTLVLDIGKRARKNRAIIIVPRNNYNSQ